MRYSVARIASIALFAATTAALAQPYPAKPIHLVVPYTPGGGSDVIAREIGSKLALALGQSVVVVNKEGAGTQIGTRFVGRSAPDGYTLLVADVPFSINPLLRSTADYDPLKDFTPIAKIGTSSMFMYSSPGGFTSVSQVVNAAKTRPGSVTVATSGYGTTTHLMAEMFQTNAGTNITQVQYKGSSPAMMDTAAGHTDLAFSSLPSALPFVQAGTLKIIGAASKTRLPSLPDVKTFEEEGVPGMVSEHWWGVLGPANMPADLVKRLNSEITKVVMEPATQEKLKAMYVEPYRGTASDFSNDLAADVKKWQAVIADNKIEVN